MAHRFAFDTYMYLHSPRPRHRLDEPFAGMNHDETMIMVDLVSKMRDQREVTVLLVEHDMPEVMRSKDAEL